VFRFLNQKNEQSKREGAAPRAQAGETSDDRKIKNMMNEVASELGVSEAQANRSPEKGKELGKRIEEEVKKRT